MADIGSTATIRQVIGANIEAARKGMGLSQSQLGGRLEQWLEAAWTRQAVSNAEAGKRSFAVDDLVGLSIGLRTSVQQLMMPPAGVETVVTPSGMEFPRGFIEDSVAGARLDAQQVERSRYLGAVEALDGVDALLTERREVLRARVADIDTRALTPEDYEEWEREI